MPLIRTSAIISAVVVLPLVGLELIYGYGDFPIVLLAFMWLLTLAFFAILIPLIRRIKTDKGRVNYFSIVPRVVCVILIAWLWVGVVADQMPCFLGVPNCD
jgi:hypothetical protein